MGLGKAYIGLLNRFDDRGYYIPQIIVGSTVGAYQTCSACMQLGLYLVYSYNWI
jgi:hypothetical protein